MKELTEYITHEIGLEFNIDEQKGQWNKSLPMYLIASYKIDAAWLMGAEVVLVHLKFQEDQPTIGQMQKHMESIREHIACRLFLFLIT
ncbi:hypothetical protein [Saccharicrinis fermentans]|uniref:Uncharacterized protein n=1 Tax=Saccharicrinis fermentans DSM 9555 = JCM 21142 TaxID=869213 RepID=W7YM42_9BACT|nr:hypothetical protein [Saccharicrinis fermentans]GAF05731.1 hypothetical protein JCM21142_104481 [Saccharicrinis fermentans DSM 9555 = JCM 21142]